MMMLVADMPPTAYVQYERLAQEVRIAESQKDVLAQVLREAMGASQSVVEFASDTVGADPRASFFKVRCLQCGRPDSESLLVQGSLRREGDHSDGRETYTFAVRDSLGRETIWRTEVQPFQASYAVVSTRGVEKDETVLEGDLVLKVCAPDFKCFTNRFDSFGKAKEKIAAWQGMKWNRAFVANTVVSDYSFAPDLMVKSGQNVKVIIERGDMLSLRTSGKALTSGGKGAMVRIEVAPFQGMGERFSTSTNRRIIEAKVSGSGEVSYEL